MCSLKASSDLGYERIQPSDVRASKTITKARMQWALGPASPKILIRGPSGVQLSCQKKVFCPLPTLLLKNLSASGLSLSNIVQVQGSMLFSTINHKHLFLRWWWLCHLAQRESLAPTSCHTCLRHKVLFQVENLLKPNPHSILDKQTFDHATLAPPLNRSRPQKMGIEALNSLLASLTQHKGEDPEDYSS